jgi:hypothetical protein
MTAKLDWPDSWRKKLYFHGLFLARHNIFGAFIEFNHQPNTRTCFFIIHKIVLLKKFNKSLLKVRLKVPFLGNSLSVIVPDEDDQDC